MNLWLLRFSFLISLVATVGSLYFSEILKFPPCVLCWYQRIFIYPLVLIFGVALWREDKSYILYACPLIVCGLVISAYHNLLYYGVISEALAPCAQAASCSSRQLELFGFITIPLMSFVGFATLLYFCFLNKSEKKDSYEK